jgi:hypothetical protein
MMHLHASIIMHVRITSSGRKRQPQHAFLDGLSVSLLQATCFMLWSVSRQFDVTVTTE